MSTNFTTVQGLIVTAIGASAIAVGALATSAGANATSTPSIQPTCEQHPGLYASGAVLGVYSTQRRGVDRDQICKVYDGTHKLLGTYTSTDYGYYRLTVPRAPIGNVSAIH